jgi:hypothetical protein
MKKVIILLFIISTIGSASEKYIKILFKNGKTKYVVLNQIEKITFNDLVSVSYDRLIRMDGQKFQSAYPNPFQSDINITYFSDFEEEIKVEIFNSQGVKIKSIYTGISTKGMNTFNWDGTNTDGVKVSTGFYCYTITSGIKFLSGKILLYR